MSVLLAHVVGFALAAVVMLAFTAAIAIRRWLGRVLAAESIRAGNRSMKTSINPLTAFGPHTIPSSAIRLVR